ncbi:hypothetical protein E2C01_036696 [Portunus trituberculatus]|uniref:Uncharacterized protein n=1 Tax=Portunus trituberculatus TaxID=210409 RepID=A0A5B7FCS7_PORTR|nr:hypothetical protein [Portunus trituberculatus]
MDRTTTPISTSNTTFKQTPRVMSLGKIGRQIGRAGHGRQIGRWVHKTEGKGVHAKLDNAGEQDGVREGGNEGNNGNKAEQSMSEERLGSNDGDNEDKIKHYTERAK